MRLRTRIVTGVGAFALIGAMVGCSVADPAPSQVNMDYSDGTFSGQNFKGCAGPGQIQYHWMTDNQIYYPEGTRTINFSTVEGADAPPLTITSKEGQTMLVNGVLSFHLDTSCKPYTDAQGKLWPGGILQKFHETVGLQQRDIAYADAGKEPGQGWDEAINKFLITPTERGVSNQALNFEWNKLFSDATTKADWERQSVEEIPKLVLAQSKEPFFVIDSITLLKPDPNQGLKDGLAAVQTSTLRAEAATIDQQTAANFPGGIVGYQQYLTTQANNRTQQAIAKAIDDGKAQIVVNGSGSPMIVGGTR